MQRSVVSYRNSTSNHNPSPAIPAASFVVSYRNSTSNHNIVRVRRADFPLYLIEILHQTTTALPAAAFSAGCILSKFYIKPQRETLNMKSQRSCILSKFYIKPQHPTTPALRLCCCILSKFYIKPQQDFASGLRWMRCILSKFYIKPQRHRVSDRLKCVVSYRNSTSNHNFDDCAFFHFCVVSYRNSTSNHNCFVTLVSPSSLYLIEILHQTTTALRRLEAFLRLYLIEILHQTTTGSNCIWRPSSCILSKFYIKPQRLAIESHPQAVVSYRNSTSNHNGTPPSPTPGAVVSYRNSTSNHNAGAKLLGAAGVVSYRNSTSNHNVRLFLLDDFWLYLIEILHQTTTHAWSNRRGCWLYLIEILHQTTTADRATVIGWRLYLIEILHQTTTEKDG